MDNLFKSMGNKVMLDFFKMMLSRVVVVGVVLAVYISYQENLSLAWAVIHGIIGWMYVFYSCENWPLFFVTISYFAFIIFKGAKLYLGFRKLAKQ